MTKFQAYVTGYNFLPELSNLLKDKIIKTQVEMLLDDTLPLNNVQAAEEVLGSGKGLEAFNLAKSLV